MNTFFGIFYLFGCFASYQLNKNYVTEMYGNKDKRSERLVSLSFISWIGVIFYLYNKNKNNKKMNTTIGEIELPKSAKRLRVKRPPLEYQYAQSLNKIIEEGVYKQNRTGIATYAIQHQDFVIKEIWRNFPILRGKKVFPKMALKEFLWMAMGRNDVKWLQEHGVTYWDEWADEQGTIGKSYGYQYRNFNGHDQLQTLVDGMLKDPLGRRHIVNLWNSSELSEMALPPCMYDYHFSCVPHKDNDKPNLFDYKTYFVDLHSKVRSNDSFLGAPYDFMFCGWFLLLICDYLNAKSDKVNYSPRNIYYTADDYHMYENHMDAVKQYLENIEENKFGVIDCPTSVHLRITQYENTDDLTLDKYLSLVESALKNKDKIEIEYFKPNNFEYGKIQADIAV